MYRRILALMLVLPLLVAGCKKSSTLAKLDDKTASAISASPPPAVATPTPPPAVDRSAKVIVLCYHRFEDNPRDSLAIAPAEKIDSAKERCDHDRRWLYFRICSRLADLEGNGLSVHDVYLHELRRRW